MYFGRQEAETGQINFKIIHYRNATVLFIASNLAFYIGVAVLLFKSAKGLK